MKNKNIIKLDSAYDYQVKIDTRNRRLELQDSEGNYESHFRKSDVLKLNAKSEKIPYYYKDLGQYSSSHAIYKCDNYYRIGCCKVTVKDMNYIKSRFKKMK